MKCIVPQIERVFIHALILQSDTRASSCRVERGDARSGIRCSCSGALARSGSDSCYERFYTHVGHDLDRRRLIASPAAVLYDDPPRDPATLGVRRWPALATAVFPLVIGDRDAVLLPAAEW